MARVGVKAEHRAGHNLPAVPEASFGIQSARAQHSGTAGAPWRLGRPERFFDYVLKKAVEYSDSVGPEPLKPRTDRHESDT
jgi:hypothetical protein